MVRVRAMTNVIIKIEVGARVRVRIRVIVKARITVKVAIITRGAGLSVRFKIRLKLFNNYD
jgi:hypothetical protein